MGLSDDLRNAHQSAKTHEAICQSLIKENKVYRAALQEVFDYYDQETYPEKHSLWYVVNKALRYKE